jgi:hypothetical protein
MFFPALEDITVEDAVNHLGLPFVKLLGSVQEADHGWQAR